MRIVSNSSDTVYYGIFFPDYARKEVLFGVRIPYEKRNEESVIEIKKQYKKEYLIIGIPVAIVSTLLLYFYYVNVIIIFLVILVDTLTYYICFLKSRKKLMALKKQMRWVTNYKNQFVTVDTKFRNEKNKRVIISWWWFVIPFSIAAVNLIAGIVRYKYLPEIVPGHWNMEGVADVWNHKSISTIIALPIVQSVMTVLLMVCNLMIARAKQQIRSSDPEISIEQNRVFRYRMSIYLLIVSIILTFIFTATNFVRLGVFNITMKQMDPLLMISTLFLIMGIVILMFTTGQGGSRVKIKNKSGEQEKHNDRDDDSYWKLGIFYFNPDDPSIFVEARTGFGWDVNFGRPLGILIGVVLPVAAIIFAIVMSM